jgi:beta-lactamase class A
VSAARRGRHRRRRHAAHRRRRRHGPLAYGLLAVLPLALVGTGVLVLNAQRGASGAASFHVDTSAAGPAPTSTPPQQRDPFADPALRSWLDGRQGQVTAALYEVATGRTYTYHPHVRQVTASMVKIDLVAALLEKAQDEHRGLTADEQTAAHAMIVASDNDSAQPIFDEVGNRDGLAAFNAQVGMTETISSYDWGGIDTTPADELQLLKAIALPSPILTNDSQSYERNLMEHVYDSERFGIPAGTPAEAQVGVKNGWYDESATGWQINSAGYVRLGDTFYLACVMTQGSPSEAYGIGTVSGLGWMLWNFESALRAPPTRFPTQSPR